MPILFDGITLTILRRTLNGEDSMGNDEYTTTEIPVTGCALSPGFSSENVQGTEQVTANARLYFPFGTEIYPTDAVQTPDNTVYEVVGNPNSFQSPFTSTQGMVLVNGREVTSGGDVR